MTSASKPELLQTCIQDLHAARRCAADRLPSVAEAAGSELRPAIEAILRSYEADCGRIEAGEHDLGGPDNLWMAGIIDDAQRDTRSVEPGPLLDIALIGAVRKGLAADIVSLETAIALAVSLQRDEDRAMLEDMFGEGRRHDHSLRALLQELA